VLNSAPRGLERGTGRYIYAKGAWFRGGRVRAKTVSGDVLLKAFRLLCRPGEKKVGALAMRMQSANALAKPAIRWMQRNLDRTQGLEAAQRAQARYCRSLAAQEAAGGACRPARAIPAVE
jgi:hypothetical protein